MKVICILACIFACAFAEPEKCCAPDQWQGDIWVDEGFVERDGGVHGARRMSFNYAYDRINKRVAFYDVDRYNNNFKRSQTILDYGTNSGVFVDLIAQSCSAFEIDPSELLPDQCVPDFARYIGEVDLGLGSDSLGGNFWVHWGAYYEEEVTFTRETCVPVYFVTSLSAETADIARTVRFTGLTDFIATPEIFEVPEFCELNKKDAPKKSHLPSFLVGNF